MSLVLSPNAHCAYPLSIALPRQSGATLVIALIFLVVLSLLGISVAGNNTLQERMAGNTRQRDLAFQAAEHARRTADAWIAAQTSSTVEAEIGDKFVVDISDNTKANFGHDNDQAYWTGYWTAAACNPAADYDGSPPRPAALAGVSSQPCYVIEKMPDSVEANPSPPPATKTFHYYRVTARGVGQDANAAVIVQTMYRFE